MNKKLLYIHILKKQSQIGMDADMLEKQIARDDNIHMKEEKIIVRILRLLAEEHLITIEEEIKGTKVFQKEINK